MDLRTSPLYPASMSASGSAFQLRRIVGSINRTAGMLVACLLLMVSCSHPAAFPPVTGSTVDPLNSTQVQSPDGGVVVEVPVGAVNQRTNLSVTSTPSATGQPGWSINLEGGHLTAPVLLKFRKPATQQGEPPPVAAWAEHPNGQLHATESTVEGDQVVVTTSHFSWWTITTWAKILQDTSTFLKEKIDRIASAPGEFRQPRCSGEDEVREQGYRIVSDSGRRVYWCAGLKDGQVKVRAVNARNYAVSAEYSPGLDLQPEQQPESFSTAWANLFKPAPSKKGNHVELVSSGQEITFTVTGTNSTAMKMTPDPGAYLVSVMQFAIDTVDFAMVSSGKSFTGAEKTVQEVLQGEQCLKDFTEVATTEAWPPPSTGDFVFSSLSMALSCAFEAAKPSLKKFLLDGFMWLITGVTSVVSAGVAIYDLATDWNGYTITITPPSSTPTTSVRSQPGVTTASWVSPSGNIRCSLEYGNVNCYALQRRWTPPPPPDDCPTDYGDAISVSELGKAGYACKGDADCVHPDLDQTRGCLSNASSGIWWHRASDPVVNGDAALPYGSAIQVGKLRCESTRQGMRCASLNTKSGFLVSQTSVKFW